MASDDLDKTFSSYAAVVIAGAAVAATQVGIAGIIAACAAIYVGACFMDGFSKPKKPRGR